MSEQTLLPCPFCGATPELVYRGRDTSPVAGSFVICDGCGVSTKITDTEAEAIAAWNRRSASTTAPVAATAEPNAANAARLITDAECAQGKCACTTTGCWGACSLSTSPNRPAAPAQNAATAQAAIDVGDLPPLPVADVFTYRGGEMNTRYSHEQMRAHALEAARRVFTTFATSTPEGWALVPLEPTPQMLARAIALRGSYSTDRAAEAETIYRAMIAAAPDQTGRGE